MCCTTALTLRNRTARSRERRHLAILRVNFCPGTAAHKASQSEATVEATAFRPWNKCGAKRLPCCRRPSAPGSPTHPSLAWRVGRSSAGGAADSSQNGKPHSLPIPPPTRRASRALTPKELSSSPMSSNCPRCGGSGTVTCPRCDGSGTEITLAVIATNCPHCHGRGEITCPRCNGSGNR